MLLDRPETLIIGNKATSGGIFYYVIVRYAVPFVALILTVSCSDKPQVASSGEEDRPIAAAQPAPDSRHVLVAFGDSLTAGFGADPGKSYPDFLQRDIDRKGYPWRVVNAGVSGDTTTDGLSRLPLVLAKKPEIVILELGANDGLRGLPVQTTKANLQQMIDAFQGAGARVVLAGMTLPPNYGPDYIKPFENIFKSLAQRDHVMLIPFLLAGVGGHPSLMQNDGLHPTGAGNRIVAQNVMAVVEPLLRQ